MSSLVGSAPNAPRVTGTNEVSSVQWDMTFPTGPSNTPANTGGYPINGYKVLHSEGELLPTQIGTTAANTRSYTNSNVRQNHTYRYVMLATNSQCNSSLSRQAVASPNAPSSTIDNTPIIIAASW